MLSNTDINDTCKFLHVMEQNNWSMHDIRHSVDFPNAALAYLRWRRLVAANGTRRAEFRPDSALRVMGRVCKTLDLMFGHRLGMRETRHRCSWKQLTKYLHSDFGKIKCPARRNKRLPMIRSRMYRVYIEVHRAICVDLFNSGTLSMLTRKYMKGWSCMCMLYENMLRGQDLLGDSKKSDPDDIEGTNVNRPLRASDSTSRGETVR